MTNPQIEMLPVGCFRPSERPQAFPEAGSTDRGQHQAVRLHGPVLIGDGGEIVAGHGRVMAAKVGAEGSPDGAVVAPVAEERQTMCSPTTSSPSTPGGIPRSWR